MKFTSLKDASLGVGGSLVNIMGAVVEIGLCRKTQGPDYIYTLKIVDNGYHAEGLPVNFFAKEVHKLPSVESVGDVLLITDVEIAFHQSLPVVRFNVDNRHLSTFSLFRSNSSDDDAYSVHPVIATPAKYAPHHIPFLHILKEWITTSPPDAVRNNNVRPISGMKQEPMDLICKVLHVCQESSNEWVLYVWDSTDLPTSTVGIRAFDEREMQMLQGVAPAVGSVLKICVPCVKFDEHLVYGGRWVRLPNVTYDVISSRWEINKKSKIRFLFDTDSVVKERLRRFPTLCSTSAISEQPPLYLTNTEENSLSKEDEPQMSYALHSNVQNVVDIHAGNSVVKKRKRRSANYTRRPSKKQRVKEKQRKKARVEEV